MPILLHPRLPHEALREGEDLAQLLDNAVNEIERGCPTETSTPMRVMRDMGAVTASVLRDRPENASKQMRERRGKLATAAEPVDAYGLESAEQAESGTRSSVTPGAESAARLLLAIVHTDIPPRPYPTEDGGLRVEWLTRGLDISCEADARGTYYVHCMDLGSSRVAELETTSAEAAASLVSDWLG